MEAPLPFSPEARRSALRVALIADMPNWAFHKIARLITPHLRPEYDCETYFHLDYDREGNPRAKADWKGLFLELRAGQFDVVHFFWRDAVLQFLRGLSADPGLRAGGSVDEWLAAVPLTTCVYDHAGLDVDAMLGRRQLFGTLVSGYVVSSSTLDRAYRAASVLPPPDGVVEDGVDRGLFRPMNLGR